MHKLHALWTKAEKDVALNMISMNCIGVILTEYLKSSEKLVTF